MRQNTLKVYVGAFVVVGLAALVMLSIYLGVSKGRKTGQPYLTFFDESVQGLSKDSPVKYRGVPVGRVESIQVAPDSRLIQVMLMIEKGLEIGPDMVAQLSPVGITGVMFIELDKASKKDKLPYLKLSFPTEYPVIPSRRSDISKLLGTFDELLNEFRSIPIREISENLNEIIANIKKATGVAGVETIGENINHVVNTISEEFDKKPITNMLKSLNSATSRFNNSMKQLDATLNEYKKSAESVNKVFNINQGKISSLLDTINSNAEQLSGVTKKLDQLITSSDVSIISLISNIETLSEEMRRTINNINNFVELFQEQPAGMLFGKEQLDGTK